MKLQKRLVAAALALLMGLSSAGCASGSDTEEKVDTKRYDEVSYSSDIEESGTVCENSRWQLNWDDENKRVSFVEKATGAVWGTTPQEACTPQVDEEGDIKITTHRWNRPSMCITTTPPMWRKRSSSPIMTR